MTVNIVSLRTANIVSLRAVNIVSRTVNIVSLNMHIFCSNAVKLLLGTLFHLRHGLNELTVRTILISSKVGIDRRIRTKSMYTSWLTLVISINRIHYLSIVDIYATYLNCFLNVLYGLMIRNDRAGNTYDFVTSHKYFHSISREHVFPPSIQVVFVYNCICMYVHKQHFVHIFLYVNSFVLLNCC